MKTPLDIVDSYASTFRELINEIVLPSKTTIRKTLGLNKDRDWDFLCTAMDIISDASAAIAHVQKFGLGGATKYDEMGERYLRLYGVLSATYIQQQAVIEIYRLMNVPNPREMKKKFDTLEIRILRHKLAAHATDYENKDSGHTEAHVPLRFEISDFRVKYMKYTGGFEEKAIDLKDAIDNHIRMMAETLDAILEKSIGTLCKGKTKKADEYREKLADLRTERKGGFVIRVNDEGETKIIVTFVTASPDFP